MLRFPLLTLTATVALAVSLACTPPAEMPEEAEAPQEAAAPMVNALSDAEVAAGWELLFDGTTLNGWEQRVTSQPDATPDWSVVDGAMLCGGTAASWIHTDGSEYGDYTLKLQFRGPQMVNSGVFLRSEKEGQPHVTGYELQVWDKQQDDYNTGSLVNYVRAPPASLIGDEWNQYEITVEGDHFLIALNGETVLDDNDASHASGVIGLQCQPEQRIEYRDIKVLTR
jgi:hypothetical protein